MGKTTTPAPRRYTYAEILAKVEGLILDARLMTVTPVLIQDKKLTPPQRETLARLTVELSKIAATVEDLRGVEEAGPISENITLQK